MPDLLLCASCVRDASCSFGAAASFLDPSGDHQLVGASFDHQVCGLAVLRLVPGSLAEADCQTGGLGEQVGASGSDLGDAGQGFSFLGLGEGTSLRVALRSTGDPGCQDPISSSVRHPAIRTHVRTRVCTFGR